MIFTPPVSEKNHPALYKADCLSELDEQVMRVCSKIHLMTDLQKNVIYPPEAYRNRVTGRIIVEYTVNKKGIIENVFPLKSVHPLLDQAAVDAVKKITKYDLPKMSRGLKKEETLRVSITFKN